MRGAPLREFAQFLTLKDPGCTFSGLRRVVTEEGMCCWTTSQGAEAIQEDADREETKDIPSLDTQVQEDASGWSVLTPEKGMVESRVLEALKLQQVSLAHLLAIQSMMNRTGGG
jgi:hypothetical protein